VPDFPALREYPFLIYLSSFWIICYDEKMKTVLPWKKIDTRGASEILQEVEKVFRGKKQYIRIATINLEYIFEARKNTSFFQALQRADIWTCESIGVFLHQRFFGNTVYRIPGVDFSWDILHLAQKHKRKVFFAVRSDGLSSWKEIERFLKRDFPRLSFSGKEFFLDEDWKSSQDICKSDVVLCNFGIPHQEYFLEKIQQNNKLMLMMGVGGAFDFWTGKQKRAPKWMREGGLEWLWRFSHNPKRIIRFFRRMF
jgi:N-acetylglucosaminyldiphosphoundecaprenol N-acetyl-beta-D-mannosaminyltransferase